MRLRWSAYERYERAFQRLASHCWECPRCREAKRKGGNDYCPTGYPLMRAWVKRWAA